MEWERRIRRTMEDKSRGRRWSGRGGEGGRWKTKVGEDGGVGEEEKEENRRQKEGKTVEWERRRGVEGRRRI